MGEVSKVDTSTLKCIRKNVSDFMRRCAEAYDESNGRLLDIAPQDHEGAAPYFKKSSVDTFDINPASGATYIADLCENNSSKIPSGHYDFVVCTEVLEHTLQPFDAVQEIERVLKPGGLAFISTPYDFRIHGPLPDCWRFTEHGLRALLKDFEILEITPLENPDRFLMPFHYTVVAKKK